MNKSFDRNISTLQRTARSVTPSIHSVDDRKPFVLDQELEPFGKWTGPSVWVPPKDACKEMAKSMLTRFGLLASKEACWAGLIDDHRSEFTQVREIELSKASIRLPKGRLFVSLVEQNQFHTITDKIPKCVQTRLDEFLAGPGKRRGVKVYYLKPLCVEVQNELIFTTKDELDMVIAKLQREVFREYRRHYVTHRPVRLALGALETGLHYPRKALKHFVERRKRVIDAYHAKLEFNRRKAVWQAAKCRGKFRTDECTFDDLLALTKTPDRQDVIEQYVLEHQLSPAERDRLMIASVTTLPWLLTVSLSIHYAAALAINVIPSIVLCDPAFVAEMPGSGGVVLKIGHFDEVNGVTHIEI